MTPVDVMEMREQKEHDRGMDVVTGIMLTVCAVEDLRSRKISLWCPAAAMAVGAVLRLMGGSLFTWDCGLGLGMGGVFLLLSMISRQQIGMGDGMILTVCGLCLGWRRVISLTFGAMVLFLAVGVVRILRSRLNGKKSVPFVPFLWVMFMLFILWVPGE